VFNAPSLDVYPDRPLTDIENFDSLKRIELMVSLESAFNVRFNASEFAQTNQISTLVDLITTKLRNRQP
jgi:acyl carrier protein